MPPKRGRPSKASIAAAAASNDELTVEIPDELDVDVLAGLLPEMPLEAPTADTVLALYRLVMDQADQLDSKQQALDEARAETEKKDVELDQALQDRETLTSDLEGQIHSLQDELKEVKQERDTLLSSQSELQTQISRLSTTSSASSSTVDDLKHRLQDTEREKRDLMGVVSRLKQDEAQRDEEIQALRKNLKEARHEHQELENHLRELRSTDTSSKFKLDSLSQQLQLATVEVARVNAELDDKSEEFTKYRRAKQAELVTLQAKCDSTTQNCDSAQASLKALQSAHSAQTHQLNQALSKVHDYTAQLAEQEAVFNNETQSLNRLVSILETREKAAKDIVDGIEKEWEEYTIKTEKEQTVLRAEAEREKKGREESDKKLDELQTVFEKMSQGELPVPGRLPGTPMRGFDESMDGMMGLSPTVAIASRAQKTGKTFTEVYADYIRLQEDYSKKCTEYDHMDRTLTQVLAQIEERAPILSQQRSEYQRLQAEATQLASQLSQTLEARDAQAASALENSQKFAKSQRECELLQTQLADLGRQVQNLLREIGRRDDPTLPVDEDMDAETTITVAGDADAMITNNLVLFRSIGGLQEQNMKLLKIIRELGNKLESEEKDYREAIEREQGEAVMEAHEAIQELSAQLERQKKSSDGIIQTYVRERDALKAVISRMEQNGGGGGGGGVNGHIAGLIGAGGEGISQDLAEIQTQFDTYRAEMGVDTVKMREDLVTAQKEVAKLQAEVAKEKARSDYYNERIRISQEEYTLRAQDLEEATKRNQKLYDQWTRSDVEFGRVSEDLRVAQGKMEQLRNECANLRAEKKIWEGVQTRLVDENKGLSSERSHLSDMMSNIQKMNNDNQRSGESDRRRLEGQLQMLEGQIQDNRSQLAEERDTVRRVTLQKEMELRELQARLDKANEDLGKTRESLVGAETSKKHLEARVEDLSKYFESNKEKLAVYERRPAAGEQSDLSKEQQLEAEVAELSASLKVAQRDLEKAKERVAQYEGISRAAEEALGQLSATHDQYKLSTDGAIAQHESTIKGLEEKLAESAEEVARVTESLGTLQRTLDAERTAWHKDKNELEGTIIELSTSGQSSDADRASRDEEVRALKERAKTAEERYRLEVVSHAEQIKAVTQLREQLSTVQASVRDNSIAAETATAKLAASETSWATQKEILEKEIAEQTKRCKEMQARNKDLLLQFEDATRQAARAPSSSDIAEMEANPGQVSEKVLDYYRQQSDYLETLLNTKNAETARLKAQADHLGRELNETRTVLSQERERAVESAASASQHSELVDKIEQLNVLRESNTTLRADSERFSKRVKILEAQLKEVMAQLEPVREEVKVAHAELEASKAHVTRLENEARHWQERNAQLLAKHEHIAEMQALQDEIMGLKTERDELLELGKQKDVRIAELEKDLETKQGLVNRYQENFRKFKNAHDSYKTTSRELQAEKDAYVLEKEASAVEKTALETKITELEAKVGALETAKSGDALEQSEGLSKLKAQVFQLTREREKWQAEKTAMTASAGAVGDEALKILWDAEKAALEAARDEALAKAEECEKNLVSANEDLDSNRQALARLNTRLTELTKLRTSEKEEAQRAQEEAVQKALATVKTEVDLPPSTTAVTTATGGDAIDVEKHAAEVTELKKKHTDDIQRIKAVGQKHHTETIQRLNAKHVEELKAAEAKLAEAVSATEAKVAEAVKAAEEKAAEELKAAEAKAAEAVAAAATTVITKPDPKVILDAIEQGRNEVAVKHVIKDRHLYVRSIQLKNMERRRDYWVSQGWITQEQAMAEVEGEEAIVAQKSTIPNVAGPSTAARIPPSGPGSSASAGPSKPTPTPNPGSISAGPPKRPLPNKALGEGPGAAASVLRGAAAGRGRGAGRGGPAGRGGNPPARGGVPRKPNGASPAPSEGGISLLGAAGGKRPHEGDGAEGSQAKRPKGPVAIKRQPPTGGGGTPAPS